MNTGTVLPVPKRVPRKQSYLTLPYPTLAEKKGAANYRVPLRSAQRISRVHLQKCLPCVRRSSWRRGSLCRWVRRPLENVLARGRWGGSRSTPLRSSGQRNIGGRRGASLRKKEEVTASAERERERRFVRVFAHLFSKTREREGRHGSEGGGGGGGVVRSSLCGGGDEGGGEGREGWLYPRMIPRLSRAGFNVLAGSAPESRGRQPSSHQTSPYTRVYIRAARTCVHACVHVHMDTYTLNTGARDTYLLRFTELHVRARALLPTHPHLFSLVCAEGRGGRGWSVHVVEEEGRT